MSHENLASLWSVLNHYEDVTICIREATGQHTLKSITHQDDFDGCLRSILTYAVEISTIFDLIRTSNSTCPYLTKTEHNGEPQKHIYSALAYLLCQIQSRLIVEDSRLARISIQIFVRSIISAICALNTIPSIGLSREAEQVTAAAQRINLQIPRNQEEYCLLQDVCSYLVSFISVRSRQENNEAVPTRRYIYNADPTSRSGIVEQLVDCATTPQMDSTDRVAAMIAICQTYWETEAFLVRSCMLSDGSQQEQSLVGHAEAATAVMETRSLIQEYLIGASMESTTTLAAQSFGPYLLFMPGLGQTCALDGCHCAFDHREASVILDMRRQKPRLLRSSLQNFYNLSPLSNWSLDYIDTIFTKFKDRLQHPNGSQPSQLNPAAGLMLRKPTLSAEDNAQSARSPTTIGALLAESLSTLEQQRPVQPTLSRRYKRPQGPSGRSGSFATIDESVETAFDSASQTSPPSLSESGRRSLSQRSGADSTTTRTSSSQGDGESTIAVTLQRSESGKHPDESHKIAVETPKTITIDSPMSFEKSYPEVAVRDMEPDNLSILSENSMPMTVLSIKNPLSRGRWGNLLRSKKDIPASFAVPRFRFFASGKHIILWTKHGGGVIDPSQAAGLELIPIHEADIVHAAGGTSSFVVISRLPEGYRLSIYRLGSIEKAVWWDIAKNPGAIDLSRNDRYLALKYTRSLHLYDLENPGTVIDHRLPVHDGSRPGFGNHLVSFAHDSLSFMAVTRFQPERVYTYWAQCAQSATACGISTYSSAPFGHVDDHGLTSLTVCGPTTRSYANGFLSTFTEKGQPVILNMNPKNATARILRDHKEQVGTRVHCSAMSADPSTGKANLVLVNQNNNVFWVTDVFGRDTDTSRVSTLKRPKSLVNDVQVAMSEVDEASIFWVDKAIQKGVLVRIGRGGGKSPPVYYRLDVDPMCSGG